MVIIIAFSEFFNPTGDEPIDYIYMALTLIRGVGKESYQKITVDNI